MTADQKWDDPPVAAPVDATNDPSETRSSSAVEPLQESTPSPMLSVSVPITPSPNNRAGSVGVRRLSEMVNERDLAILRSVEEHRLLLTTHIFDLHFWNHTSWASGIRACNRVLNRLREHRLLRRLERRTGGAGGGSKSFVWALDVAGDRLLRDRSPDAKRRRPFEPSTNFLGHTLAIADRRIEAERGAREGRYELLRVVTEPSTWRTFQGRNRQTIWLKPDLELTTAVDEYEYDWAVEQDMGTESGPALVKKCSIYQQYFRTGTEQRERGAFPKVLWVMHREERAEFLRRELQKAGIDRNLFTVIQVEQFAEALGDPERFMNLTAEGRSP